jgi:protein TonB
VKYQLPAPAYARAPLAGCFALSLVVHLLLLLLWPKFPTREPLDQPIPVSLLPPPQVTEPERFRAPNERAPRPTTPAPAVKKALPQRERVTGSETKSQEKTREPTPAIAATISKVLPPPEEKPATPAEAASPTRQEPSWPPREPPVPERSIIAGNRLPGVQELLPSERRIPLGTKEPRYASYLENVRRAIDFNWVYPELALLYGLQGKLVVEFTIGANGAVEFLTLVRSSGSNLLDEEALRAIRAAAPFPPIPHSVNANRLLISASMEYYDRRLNYQLGR